MKSARTQIQMSVLFVIASIAFGASVAHANPACTAIFAADELTSTIQALALMRLNLDAAQADGASSVGTSALKADYQKKEAELVAYVKRNNLMSLDQLKNELKLQIAKAQAKTAKTEPKEDQRSREQRRQISDTAITGERGIFHTIKSGTFEMVLEETKFTNGSLVKTQTRYPVTIEKPFQMMATPVTQVMWETITNLSKAYNLEIPLANNPSSKKGDLLPVENISPVDIDRWITAINQLSDLGAPELSSLLVNHKPGNHYRLPTESEWEYVITKRGQSQDEYFFGNDISQITGYAWVKKNARNTTHPVALLKPLEFEGMDFYDMLGNVEEFTTDSAKFFKITVRGTPPTYNPLENRILRGGHYLSEDRLSNRGSWTRYVIASPLGGFRLVRELE